MFVKMSLERRRPLSGPHIGLSFLTTNDIVTGKAQESAKWRQIKSALFLVV